MNVQATAVEGLLAGDASTAARFVTILNDPSIAQMALNAWEFKTACEAPLVFEQQHGSFTDRQRQALREIAKKMAAWPYFEDTLITRRRNRVTKGYVSLEFHPKEDPTCRWTTICDTHSTCCGHESRKRATSFLSVPWEWCEECREIPAVRKLEGAVA